MAALVAVFVACFRDYAEVLAKGERGTVMVIAADRKQSRTVFRYVEAFIDGSPMLARMVESRTKESIDLTNRITIEVHTASFRAVRGYTIVGAVLDEIAYWPSDEASANPDVEIVNALRPEMATVPGAMLLAISSPYARKGGLWSAYERHFGTDGDPVLVWRATSLEMNPALPAHVVEEAYALDAASASAEYSAEFRRDVETYVSREVVASCTIEGRHELPPVSGVRYVAFTDPSGGSSDSFTLAVAHEERGVRVLDAIRERRPPSEVRGDLHRPRRPSKRRRCRDERTYSDVSKLEAACRNIRSELRSEPPRYARLATLWRVYTRDTENYLSV